MSFRTVNVAPLFDVKGKQLPSGSNASLPPMPSVLSCHADKPAGLPFSHFPSLLLSHLLSLTVVFISDYILSNPFSGNFVVLWPLEESPQEAGTRETFENFPWPSLKQG